MENQNPDGQLQIELKEEIAQGTYANLSIITHSSSEFILDFVRVLPGLPKAGVHHASSLHPNMLSVCFVRWKKTLRSMNVYSGRYDYKKIRESHR